MIQEILVNGVTEVLKHIIKGFFEEEKEEIKLSEIQKDIERLERNTNHKIDKLGEQIRLELLTVIREVPYIQIKAESIVLNPEIIKIKERTELKSEVVQTLKNIMIRRQNEIAEYVDYEEVVEDEKPLLEWKEEKESDKPSEWEEELKNTLNNIRTRRLNIK